MKKTLYLALATGALLLNTTALAASDGFYLHAKAGWERTDYSTGDFDYMQSVSIHNESFSLSPSLGYQINPNFAVEASYLDWHSDFDNIALSNNPQNTSTLRNGSINNYSLDVSAKGMLPIKDNFGAFAKLGAAYVQSIHRGGMNDSTLGNDYHNTYAIRPITTFGFSYDINDATVVDIGQTHLYQGSGIPSADFSYIGLSHHFG